MREIKIPTSPKVRVLLDQGECILRKPTMGDVEALQIAQKDDAIAPLLSFFEALGMPAEMVRSLDIEQMEAIKSGLMPEKKALASGLTAGQS